MCVSPPFKFPGRPPLIHGKKPTGSKKPGERNGAPPHSVGYHNYGWIKNDYTPISHISGMILRVGASGCFTGMEAKRI